MSHRVVEGFDARKVYFLRDIRWKVLSIDVGSIVILYVVYVNDIGITRVVNRTGFEYPDCPRVGVFKKIVRVTLNLAEIDTRRFVSLVGVVDGWRDVSLSSNCSPVILSPPVDILV